MIKRAYARVLFIAAVCGLSLSIAQAASYYISPTGNDTTGDGTSGTPWKTLTKARSSGATCGDTVILKDGLYNYTGIELNPTNLPACTSWASSSFTIRSENGLGNVIVSQTDAFDLQGAIPTETTYYLKLDGIIWKGNYTKNLSGNFVYVKNFGFEGGPTSGNNTMFEMGNNNFGSKPSATHILMEDGYFLGYSTGSGRYMCMMYDTDYVVIRRAVNHIEDGWDDGGSSNPSANWTFYNARHTALINVFAVDTLRMPDTYQGAYYFVNNSGQPQEGDFVSVLGSMAMNVNGAGGPGWALYFDNGIDYSSATISNFSAIDTEHFLAGGYGGAVGLRLDNWTARRSSFTTAGGEVLTYGSAGTKVIRNGICKGYTSGVTGGADTIITYDDWNNCGTAPGNAGEITTDPLTIGASYYTRTEVGSTLYTAGLSGAPMGAQIIKRIGDDGDFYDDSGWATETATNLFPFPNETVIKQRFCSGVYSDGLCAAGYSSLTFSDYVNGRGANPYADVDVTSPTAPGTPMVTSTGTTTLDISWDASSDAVGVSSYEIDVDNNSDFSSPLVGYNDQDIGSGTTEQLTGLSASTQYYFRLRAKDAAGNTSTVSTAGTGTTNAEAPASSNTLKIQGSITLQGGVTFR